MKINVYFHNLISGLIPASYGWALRTRLARMSGLRIGDCVKLNFGVYFSYKNIVIRDEVWVGPFSRFFSTPTASIEIGHNCDIAPGVSFITGTHELGGASRRAGVGVSNPIKIGNGCRIGAQSIILGGVELQSGSIGAAGSRVLPGV